MNQLGSADLYSGRLYRSIRLGLPDRTPGGGGVLDISLGGEVRRGAAPHTLALFKTNIADFPTLFKTEFRFFNTLFKTFNPDIN